MNAIEQTKQALEGFINAVRLSRMSCDGRSAECEFAEQILAAEEALAALSAIQSAEPVACLHLGGITDGENPEFEDNDISLNTKAIEALQQRLVSWGNNHTGCDVDLYASPLPQERK